MTSSPARWIQLKCQFGIHKTLKPSFQTSEVEYSVRFFYCRTLIAHWLRYDVSARLQSMYQCAAINETNTALNFARLKTRLQSFMDSELTLEFKVTFNLKCL